MPGPNRCTPGERPSTHCIQGWVGPSIGLAALEKIWNSCSSHACVGAVPWLRRLIVSFSPRRPDFNPWPGHARFFMNEVALGLLYLSALGWLWLWLWLDSNCSSSNITWIRLSTNRRPAPVSRATESDRYKRKCYPENLKARGRFTGLALGAVFHIIIVLNGARDSGLTQFRTHRRHPPNTETCLLIP